MNGNEAREQPEVRSAPETTYWGIVRVQFAKHKTAVFGLRVVVLLFALAIFAPLLATSSPLYLNKDGDAFLKAYDANKDGQVESRECDDPVLFDEVDTAATRARDQVASKEDIAAWGAPQSPWVRDLFDRNIWQSGVDIFFNVALVLLLPFLVLWFALRRHRKAIAIWSLPVLVLSFVVMMGPLTYSSSKRDYVGRVLGLRHELALTEQRLEQFTDKTAESTLVLEKARENAAREGLSEDKKADADAILSAAEGDHERTARSLAEWQRRGRDATRKASEPVYRFTAVMPPVGFHHADQNTERVMERPTRIPELRWGMSHILGTDGLGRDVFARILYGTRISLTVGVIATAIYCLIGTIIGAIMGFFGGKVDMILMRFVEIMMCFPRLAFILIIVGVFDTKSIFLIMVAIGLVGWAGVARLIRGQFFSERGLDYVTAARALGIPTRRIVFKHVLPNAIHPVFVSATFGVAAAILVESGLAFLGLGDPNVPSWGQILFKGRETMAMWLILSPGFAIFLTVTALNLVGEGLRDALDPKLRQ